MAYNVLMETVYNNLRETVQCIHRSDGNGIPVNLINDQKKPLFCERCSGDVA